MKHYTCDKCGMPMDNKNIIQINNKEYDICEDCQKIIFRNLENKGNHIETPEIKEIKKKFPHQWDY